jgi:hypothetical protein
MEPYTIALFGEAEKGDYQTAYLCRNLPQLVEYLGNPPPNSLGLYIAIQALLYHRDLIFFRVQEEGFSFHDYLAGLRLLETQNLIGHIGALCLPGVGDAEIIHAMTPFCIVHHTIIITSESDLYDYLTQR